MKDYDFSGWATRNNIKCSDGRTILKDAFKHNSGTVVPLVWNHSHNDPSNVLGHALLENREEGVYAYGKFNDTEYGQQAKSLVEHGDITALSIYANQLKERNGNVFHGSIRELSLVLAGANPEAFIENIIKHGEEESESAVIYVGENNANLTLEHAEEKSENESEETIQDVLDTFNEKQRKVLEYLIGQALTDAGLSHADEDENEENLSHAEDESEETIQDVLDTFNEKQRTVLEYLIGQALTEENKGGNEEMKHNVFENEQTTNDNVLSHSEMQAIIADAKRYGSLKDSVLAHGIDQIEYLFPDATNLNKTPEFIKREMGWVQKVLGSVHHTPFSRIKSQFADITADDARAKGYIKGKLKKEEVFGLLKRTTTPTTIYKKQKLDRDDVIDITDFDVVAWLKSEMRMMLDEEIARAILVGDGRLASSDDKINEQNIRPIVSDHELYTVKADVEVAEGATECERAKAFIRAAIKNRKFYKGTGSPTLYTTEDLIADCLLLEDKNGRVIYETMDKLANTLRVKEIIAVPVMEGVKGVKGGELAGIMVNLNDYNVGADKGGAINMFDDFDIDYNAQKYLIETRCSGALIKPYSAIAFEFTAPAAEPEVGE